MKAAMKGGASLLTIFTGFLTVFFVGSTKTTQNQPAVGLRAGTTVYADVPPPYAQSFYQGAYGGAGGGDGGGGGGDGGCDDDGGDDDGDDDDS